MVQTKAALLFIVSCVFATSEVNEDEKVNPNSGLPRKIEREIELYFETDGQESKTLDTFIESVSSDHCSKRNSVMNADIDLISCTICLSVTFAFLTCNCSGKKGIVLKMFFNKVCSTMGYDEEFCNGIYDLNIPIFNYIKNHNPNLTPQIACGIMLQQSCSDYNATEWSIDTHDDVPFQFIDKVPTNSSPIIIAHLADIHYDPLYKVGSDADCTGKPICCRNNSGIPETRDKEAGYWGDYRRCDLPIEAVKNVFEQIKKSHPNVDYVYFTGDITSHNIWDTTYSQIYDSLRLVYKLFQKYFADIPVYSVLGNHETQPLNVFAPLHITEKNFTTKWLFQLCNKVWSPWFPPNTKSTILKGGFYSILVRPGFRIIGINSNVCYTFNWWLLLNTEDPYGQLQWLSDELLKAETNNEYVHILSHVPPGEFECEKIWSREYVKIVNRFAHIIKGQFNGHTHYDELRVFYKKNKKKIIPTNVAFNGGSLTTWTDVNPNYRIFKVDPSNFEILDFEQWTYNLTEANLSGKKPSWYKLYGFKEEYKMKSLKPSEIHNLVLRMVSNSRLIRDYIQYKGKNASPHIESAKMCDEKCFKTEICRIVKADYFDETVCKMVLH